MQPKQLDPTSFRQKPLPRVNRGAAAPQEDGEGHLWAVSYADLLMVLMSFFIIFFSFTDAPDKHRSSDPILDIALGLQGALKAQPSHGSEPPVVTGARSQAQENLVSTIAPVLSKLASADTVAEGRYVFIRLPDDMFGKRQFKLTAEIEAKLDTVYEALKPMQDKIDVVVVGHSDSSRVSGSTNPYLSDNFDLSSLRALRALQFLLGKGFPQANISAQASADGRRNSRTLSIRIQMKESPL